MPLERSDGVVVQVPEAVLRRTIVPPDALTMEQAQRDQVASESSAVGRVLEPVDTRAVWGVEIDVDVAVSEDRDLRVAGDDEVVRRRRSVVDESVAIVEDVNSGA